ncbi:MAG: carbon starvation protein A [Deltaproteobacteria bacterium]|nr:carbon starvation protein A [Deltaproteobacteria bacterium]
MSSIPIILVAALGYVAAYRLYGSWLGRRIFKLDRGAVTPAHALEDGEDFVPTKTEVLFGHHFTTIAGTGPIVGPAIAVIWGWVPAILWVVLGPIFMGAVHDLGALVISSRHRAESIGEIAEEIISPRVRTLFLLIIFFLLLLVIAVFGWVIAVIFKLYPQAVIPVWAEVPIALWLAWAVAKNKVSLRVGALVAVAAMYAFVYVGYKVPFTMPEIAGVHPTVTWIVILLAYSYVASILPVQRLLQPRDFINSHQLFIVMAALVLGLAIARPAVVAPTFDPHPTGAPPMIPMIFVIIACGAISGFHSLAGSGTTSKQMNSETDALPIGYGSMLLEGFLAVLVILACTAGFPDTAAWKAHYGDFAVANGLGSTVDAFVHGSSNIMAAAYGLPVALLATVMGVFVVSFASTSLDSATRIQRYVVAELAADFNIDFFKNKHAATSFAVVTAAALALAQKGGTGALLLWPLFGTTNQLLAGLTFLVIWAYLLRRGSPTWFAFVPMVFMIAMTGWAMVLNLDLYYQKAQWHLLVMGGIVLVLEIWMIAETVMVSRSLRAARPERSAG